MWEDHQSSTTEFVSVPRELAENIASALCDHDASGLTVLLQALLDKPFEQHQMEPVARVEVAVDRNVCITITDLAWLRDLKAKFKHLVMPLYAGPAQADAGDVERLTRKCQNADLALKAQTENFERQRESCKTDYDALLRICTTLGLPPGGDMHADGPALANALRNLLNYQDKLLAELDKLNLNSERYLWIREHAVRIQGSQLWYQGAALDFRVDVGRNRMAEQAKSVQEGGMRLLKRQPE